MSVRIGVVGAGQLARMMIAPAVELGIDLRVLAEAEGMSAQLATSEVGDYRDLDIVRRFAAGVDVLTFDHEHVPQDVLRALVAEGVVVRPGPEALRFAQDKLAMRERLAELGVPQPDWAPVRTAEELEGFLADHGGRAVVKMPRGGYDGKGVRVVTAAADAADWLDALSGAEALLAEELVIFTRELAQQVARRPSGEIVAYPVVETVQFDGVCAEVFAPAPRTSSRVAEAVERIGRQIAEGLGVVGMLAVELFETADARILVNELAMRPHNSGHWTQDGAITSQFEQHLRAVADLPLGAVTARAPWVVMVNILGGPEGVDIDERFAGAMAQHPAAKIHTYGKASRPGRKVGHVTVAGEELDEVIYRARAAAAHFA